MVKRFFIKTAIFTREVYLRIRENDLVDMANALSFKLILSIFPFIIFIMSSAAFFKLDLSGVIPAISSDIPIYVQQILSGFVSEVVETRHLSLLSSSLLVMLFSASSGVYTLTKGLNRAYNTGDKRGYILQRFISLLLVVILTALIIVSLYVYIFSDRINEFMLENNVEIPMAVVNMRSYVITAALTFVMIILIYMLAVAVHTSVKQLVPGTLFTMGAWMIISKVFNMYVNNFSRYSTIYGSIGAMFVFALWLNLLSYVLLIGGQINALIYDSRWMNGLKNYNID
jgi:membrane protein